MRFAISIFLTLLFMTMTINSNAADAKYTIFKTSSEATPASDIIRLKVSDVPDDFQPKVICDNGLIRIRMMGLELDDSDSMESVATPDNSPIDKIRLVPKQAGGTIAQLFVSHNALSICSLTNAFVVNGEVVISVGLDNRHIAARKEAVNILKQAENKEIKKVVSEKPKNSLISKLLSEDDASEKNIKSNKKDLNAVDLALAAVTADNNNSGDHPEQKGAKNEKKSQLLSDTSEGPGQVQVAAAILFILLIAGAALYLKRNKLARAGNDANIDILSSKRISAKQQLVVAEVQGTRFLLGISENSVNTLGTLMGNDTAQFPVPNVDNTQNMKSFNFNTSAYSNGVKSDNIEKSFTFEDRGAEPKGSSYNSNKYNESGFEGALNSSLRQNTHTVPGYNSFSNAGSKMSSNIGSNKGHNFSNNINVNSNTGSNAAGLMALARMRADIEAAANQTPKMQA
ncbi:MAG: FliO/MopB family protein [Deltaproteobacteria bacterium]|nr:FliO/MopB family protein [Deltaproteobacteria bacterium]